MIYIYKWTLQQERLKAYGVDANGRVHCINYPQKAFILLQGQENARSLPGIKCLAGVDFIDEYGGGEIYSNLYHLESGPGMSIDCLREIGDRPERFHYRKSFLNHVDPIHNYFMLKHIPYYSGWFDQDTGLPIPDKKRFT